MSDQHTKVIENLDTIGETVRAALAGATGEPVAFYLAVFPNNSKGEMMTLSISNLPLDIVQPLLHAHLAHVAAVSQRRVTVN